MYLESVENFSRSRFDVAVVEAGIPAQLALKALIVKQGFEPPRTHAVRQLILLPGNALGGTRVLREEQPQEVGNPRESMGNGQYSLYPVKQRRCWDIHCVCKRGVKACREVLVNT